MFNFLNLKPDSFGLSISDSVLRIAKLKKKRKFFTLASFGKTEVPLDTIQNGKIKNEDNFINCLKEALKNVKGEKLKTKNVVFSLPESKAFFTIFQMPKMTEEELKLAVPFEAENYIPIQTEEFYFDFQVIPPLKNSLDHLDVQVVAIAQEIVDPYVFCLKKAGLVPVALEIEPYSIVRAVIKNEVAPFPVLIINFEDNYTNLTIFSGYSIRLTSSIPFSSKDLIKRGRESLKINLNELIDQIKKYISYYQTHASHQHISEKNGGIEKIIISGKKANLRGLPSFLSFSLNLPLEIANPWVNILAEPFKKIPKLSFGESLEYTVALGLALRGTKEDILKA